MYLLNIRNDWAWNDEFSGTELVCETKQELQTLLDIALKNKVIVTMKTLEDKTADKSEDNGRR